MDATGTERAVVASLSTGAQYQLALARLAPERVAGAAFMGPVFPYTPSHPRFLRGRLSWSLFEHPCPFVLPLVATIQRGPVARGLPAFAEWFISRCFPEPHSTKPIEDGVGWALETDGETLVATAGATVGHSPPSAPPLRTLATSLRCPVLVVSGEQDKITPPRDARTLARLTSGSW